jgi:Zn-dependent protease with chaperone function
MYNQIIYFIIALLLFSIQQPGSEPFFSPLGTLVLAAGFFLVYVLTCYIVMRRLKHALAAGISDSAVVSRYLGMQGRLSILALVYLAVDVYGLNINYYLQNIPGYDTSLTLQGLTGLGLLLIHLGVVWLWSYPVYRHIYQSRMKPWAFLKGNVAFSAALLIPWFLISVAMDALQLFSLPGFLKTEAGQFLLMGVLLLLFVLFAPRLVVRLWGCRALPMTALRMDLESFVEANHFKVGNFMLWPLFGGEMLTAGIIGVLPRWRYILLTQSLLRVLNGDELRAVVAHEMGHVRRHHMLLYLAFFLFFSILAYAFNDLVLLLLLQNDVLLDWILYSETMNTTLLSAVYSAPMIIMLVVYFRYIFGYFLRNSERQADLYALQVIGNPLPLVSSLRKIAFCSGRIEDLPSWHHYSIRQRIEFLLNAYEKPGLIRTHEKRYYASAALFFLLVTGLITLGFSLESSKVARHWRSEIQLGAIERAISRGGGDHRLYSVYGGLLLDLGQFGVAESVLRKSLESAPEDANALNNLAWLYATSPPPYFNPEAALDLALRAAAREPDPIILDTLAEAYYANGQAEEALRTIIRALHKEPKNPDYFLKQKQKFESAVKSKRENREKGWEEDG